MSNFPATWIHPMFKMTTVVVVVDFLLACENLGGRFDDPYAACAFSSFL